MYGHIDVESTRYFIKWVHLFLHHQYSYGLFYTCFLFDSCPSRLRIHVPHGPSALLVHSTRSFGSESGPVRRWVEPSSLKLAYLRFEGGGVVDLGSNHRT